MRGDDPIGQELAQLSLRPAAHEQPRHQVEVGARVDVVGDAGCDDRQGGRGALAADVEPGEQPVLAAQNQWSELALEAIVGRLDVPVVEEEQEPLPLTMKITKRATERRLGRNGRPVAVQPVSAGRARKSLALRTCRARLRHAPASGGGLRQGAILAASAPESRVTELQGQESGLGSAALPGGTLEKYPKNPGLRSRPSLLAPEGLQELLAPAEGLEPPTWWLTATRSTD
jgi:hypothetical protein